MEHPRASKGKADTVVFIKTRLREMGGDAEARFLEALPTDASSAYATALPVSWLPCEDLAIICDRAAAILYPGDPKAVCRLGHDSGTASYTGVYRVLIRVASIQYLLEKASSLWKNHYTAGVVSIERTGDRSIVLSVRDFPDMPKTMRELAAGYYVALTELAGEKGARVVCDDRPPVWRWVVSWN